MIALGLDYIFSVCKEIFETQKILTFRYIANPITTQEGFSSNLMASSTTLQLGKSSWPSQILSVYRLGEASRHKHCQIQTTHTLR